MKPKKTPEDDLIPCSCPCCETCFIKPGTSWCWFGSPVSGPYDGYRRPDGVLVDRHDNPIGPR